MRSLWTARDALSNVVEIREQLPKLDFVDTCRIANAHKSSHETEKPPAHVGAPAIQKDLDRFRTAAQNLGDFHVTRYVFHRGLLAERRRSRDGNCDAQRPGFGARKDARSAEAQASASNRLLGGSLNRRRLHYARGHQKEELL